MYLNLGDGSFAHRGVSDCKPRDALLAEGAVEHAVRPELLLEAARAAEHAPEGHIFSKHNLVTRDKPPPPCMRFSDITRIVAPAKLRKLCGNNAPLWLHHIARQ